jgi:predicted peptidase
MLVFLHGSGAKGNSSVDTSVLNVVLRDGPPKLIYSKNWSPSSPMIVVSPQCHEDTWDAAKLHQLIKFITQDYRINMHRIYLTGFSMGGYGTFSYIDAYSDTGYVAAAVPICGGGNPLHASKFKNTPLWAFHGEADRTVPVINSINMVQAINAQHPAIPAALTTYPGVDHDSWTRTYDGTGMGTESKSYDPFNKSIYDWMLQYTK